MSNRMSAAAYLLGLKSQWTKYGHCGYCPKCGGKIWPGNWENIYTANLRWKNDWCRDCGFEVGTTDYSILDVIKLRMDRLRKIMIRLYKNARLYTEKVRGEINRQHPKGRCGINDGWPFDEYDDFELYYEEAMNLYFCFKEILAYCNDNNIQI